MIPALNNNLKFFLSATNIWGAKNLLVICGGKSLKFICGGKSLKFIVCSVGVFSKVFLAEAVANRTHNQPLSPGLSVHKCYPTSSWEKEVLSISIVTAEVRENFSLVPGRHAHNCLPVRGPLGTATFLEFLSFFYFIFVNL